ncbi:hypothetical protein [Vibrio astriarenae]|uniref:hypothetical protein n=1 Tax=Vibrio astriarenae TaxID=1481923 RepID=UPI00373589EA
MTKTVDIQDSWKQITKVGFSGLIQNIGSRDMWIFIGENPSSKGHKLKSGEFMRLEKTSRPIFSKATSTHGDIAITEDD